MARVCRALKDEGFEFLWYVVGDGQDRGLLEAEISALGIDDRMTLLGQLANPFPAYRSVDVVAMLSRYEGLCGVVNEARVMEKAVVATEVSGIREQLTDGVNGLIVPQDVDAIVSAMARVLSDATLPDRAWQPEGIHLHCSTTMKNLICWNRCSSMTAFPRRAITLMSDEYHGPGHPE